MKERRLKNATTEADRKYTMWMVSFSSFGIGYTWGMQFARVAGLYQALGLDDNEMMMVG
jgi:hypothetical protein